MKRFAMKCYSVWLVVMVLCVIGELSEAKECIRDDFVSGESELFSPDDWCEDGCKGKIVPFGDVKGEFDTDDSVENDKKVVFIDSAGNFESDPFEVVDSTKIQFKNVFKRQSDGIVIMSVHKSSDNFEIKRTTAVSNGKWTDISLDLENIGNEEVYIKIAATIIVDKIAFALDHIAVTVDDEAECPIKATTPTESTPTGPTDPPPQCPEDCVPVCETDEMEMWKTVAIAGICVAGVTLISTITLSVLLAKKANAKPEPAVQQWPDNRYPQRTHQPEYSTVGSTGLPRLQPKPRMVY